MAFQAFLRTTSDMSDVIKGESKIAAHEEWNDITDFNYSGGAQYTMGTGGVTYTGAPTFEPVSVSMLMDGSFPLYQQAMNESHNLKVEIHAVESAGQDPFHVIELTNARLVQISVGTGGGARPHVSFSFAFEEILYQYTPFEDGVSGAASEFVWSLAAGESG